MTVTSTDPALRRALLGEINRAGRRPIPATGPDHAASSADHAASSAGRGALLLAVLSHRHPSPASDTPGGPPLVNDEWVQWLRQALLGGRWLLRPGAPVVTVTRPTRYHGQLLDLPGTVITAGRAAGLVPIQRCAAVTISARGTPVPIRPGWAEHDVGRVRRLTGYPISRVAHHDIVVFQTPPALTETAVIANALPPGRPTQLPGNPFEPRTLERPAA